MTAWLESIGVVALAVVGARVGRWLSACPRPGGTWIVAFLAAFSPIVLIAVAKRVKTLGFLAPFSWLVAGRTEFVVTSFCAAMALSVLAPRLRRRRDQTAVRVAVAGFTLFVVLPFALPPFLAASLTRMPTSVDVDGVCRQSTGYNCGPAAAVTALRLVGLSASEGELAVLARTTPVAGTQTDILCAVLSEKYEREGLRCEYRRFDSFEALRSAGVVITVINFSLLVDHFVTVLEVTDREVRLGDPVDGVRRMRRDQFERVWRRVGIVLERRVR